MASYERYQSLVQEAWQYYCQGDQTRMARSLEQSLEYTPYLRSETISDWISKFQELSLKHPQTSVDVDYLTDVLDLEKIFDLTSYQDRDDPKIYSFMRSLLLNENNSYCLLPLQNSNRYHDVKIIYVFDIFSEACFQYEANFIPADKDNWRQQFETIKPILFLAESAWKGNSGAWTKMMTEYAKLTKNPLKEILNYCKLSGIKTVFWNKEDPPNFNVFIDVAQDFEYIFTTDCNCVKKYQNICGHQRVFSLPFAAQPRIHNPHNPTGKTINRVCFAGTWYSHKYEERRTLLRLLLEPALEQDVLDIFDRQFDFPDKRYRFPNNYQKSVIGNLNYAQMLLAYRLYNVFLNVNSVTSSPTMFSRRVFEVLACGTPVISTKSIGMEEMLGNFVKITDSKDSTARHIKNLLNNCEYKQKLGHLGYRYIHQHHTYRHRLNTIFSKVGIKLEIQEPKPLVSVVIVVRSIEALQVSIKNYANQLYQNKELLLILQGDWFCSSNADQTIKDLPNTKVFHVKPNFPLDECYSIGIDNATGCYCSPMKDNDLYGKNFISDLILSLFYTDADVIIKGVYFKYIEGINQLFMVREFKEHQYIKQTQDLLIFQSAAALINMKIFQTIHFRKHNFCFNIAPFLKRCNEHGKKIYSSDKYNYVLYENFNQKPFHFPKILSSDFLNNTSYVCDDLKLKKVMI